MQWVNEAVQVFNRDGSPKYGPTLGRALWKDFGGDCQTLNDGDPIVQYDKIAEALGPLAIRGSRGKNIALPRVCCGVDRRTMPPERTRATPTGSTDFNDYPKVGVWADGYYITFNMFDRKENRSAEKSALCPKTSCSRAPMRPMQCFDVPEVGLLPADIDGLTPPPAGSPELVMNFTRDALQTLEGSHRLDATRRNQL